MRKMTAKMHKGDGSIGRPCLKIACPEDGAMIPADACRPRYCRANRGYKEWLDDGVMKVETLCGLEDMKQ